MEEIRTEKPIMLQILKDYWFLFAFVVTIAFGWASIQGQVAQNKAEISTIESKQEVINTTLLSIQLDVAEIKTLLKNNQ